MVTAETAAVLPVLAVLLAVALWSVSAVAAQLRCVDAAREAARAAARGEPAEVVYARARDAGPAGAAISVSGSAGLVTVAVNASVGGHWVPSVAVHANAVAAVEPPSGR